MCIAVSCRPKFEERNHFAFDVEDMHHPVISSRFVLQDREEYQCHYAVLLLHDKDAQPVHFQQFIDWMW